MTFLELCRRYAAEVHDLGGPPKTLTDGSPRTQAAADAIRESWEKIQLLRNDWEWLRGETPIPTQTMTMESDVPHIESPYHMAIVWYAVAQSGYRQAATELIAIGEREWNVYYGLLVKRYVPQLSLVSGRAW
ncbi:TPA: hypothetical protein ACSP22_000385 [Aeromonas veronii]